MTKAVQLKQLEEELLADKSLPLATNLVFGEGSINCTVMFIGEAPGMNEDIQKRPFVGRGGQLLNKNLESIGWKREDVYITNIVKRRPPENRDPLPEEITAYKPYLTRQIEIINPKIIISLGRFSMNYFLPDAKISRDQGKVFRVRACLKTPYSARTPISSAASLPLSLGIVPAIPQSDCEAFARRSRHGAMKEGLETCSCSRFIVPMFHPAAALRAPGTVGGEFAATFRRLSSIITACEAYEEKRE